MENSVDLVIKITALLVVTILGILLLAYIQPTSKCIKKGLDKWFEKVSSQKFIMMYYILFGICLVIFGILGFVVLITKNIK
jgi:hypothetical protein